MRQNRFLLLARKESKRSDHHSHKLGCVIVRGSRILGIGHNMMKTHAKSNHSFKSVHAEFMAILNSGRNIRGATAYIFREQKNGIPAMSRPCKDCWKLLMEYGIKNVVYSFEGTFVQERL
jgi:deoxycytidylate deaminase